MSKLRVIRTVGGDMWVENEEEFNFGQSAMLIQNVLNVLIMVGAENVASLDFILKDPVQPAAPPVDELEDFKKWLNRGGGK